MVMDDQELASNIKSKPTDYDIYIMTKKERLGYIALAVIALYIFGYIFYHNIMLAFVVTPFSLLYPKIKNREIIDKRKNELNIQFKDMLYSLSSSMSAGRALEPSFKEVLKDLQIIYPSEGTYIIEEVEHIVKNLEMNERVEEILLDFAQRSHLEDIKNFVDVLQSCRKAGGNLVEVVRTTTAVINDKIEIKNEIDTMIAEKKFEQKLMSLAPVAMVLMLTVAAEDYMSKMFTTMQGNIAMTVAMITVAITYFVSRKIMKINI